MKIVRLKESGFLDGQPTISEDKTSLTKRCLMVYCGKFESMDGPVEIKDEDIETLAANHNSLLSKLSRMATGGKHPRFSPPIQLDHSTSARDTVGRLEGGLEVGEHELEDGTKVKALYGTAKILGKENVEKVEDGRWCHLSGGFDLESHNVSELTITPFPAAGEAHMLSRERLAKTENYRSCVIEIKKTDEEGTTFVVAGPGIPGQEYTEDISGASAISLAKKIIDGWWDDELLPFKANKKLSAEELSTRLKAIHEKSKLSSGEDRMGYKETKEKADLYAKCKKHLMDEKKMSEEDADKHLESAKDEELKKMSADEDARQKKLADEKVEKEKADKEAELKRLSANKDAKDKIVKLSKDLRGSNEKVRLGLRKATIDTRLARFQAETKITPAERKAIKIDDLAALDDKALEAALGTYAKREPVIDVGVRGTTKGLTAGAIRTQLKKVGGELEELRTALNMSTKRPEALKRLSELGLTEQDVQNPVRAQQVGPSEDPRDEADLAASYAHLKKLWGEGKEDEALAHFKKHLGAGIADETVGPDQSAHMSALAAELKTMQSSFDEVVKLAAPALGITEAELA